MKTLVLIAGLLVGTPHVVRAGCTVDEVANETQFKEIRRVAELAQQAKRALRKIEEVASHAKDPNKSIGDQLSKDELDEFSQARGRYQAIELLETIESIYERDIRVIQGIYEVTQGNYLGKPYPDKKDSNYLNYSFLAQALKFDSSSPGAEIHVVRGRRMSTKGRAIVDNVVGVGCRPNRRINPMLLDMRRAKRCGARTDREAVPIAGNAKR